jgi:hypothetical protein
VARGGGRFPPSHSPAKLLAKLSPAMISSAVSSTNTPTGVAPAAFAAAATSTAASSEMLRLDLGQRIMPTNVAPAVAACVASSTVVTPHTFTRGASAVLVACTIARGEAAAAVVVARDAARRVVRLLLPREVFPRREQTVVGWRAAYADIVRVRAVLLLDGRWWVGKKAEMKGSLQPSFSGGTRRRRPRPFFLFV